MDLAAEQSEKADEIAGFEKGLVQTLGVLDDVSDQIYIPLLQKALRAIPLQRKNAKILELGAGIGTLTRELLAHGAVTATDLSPRFVSQLNQRFAGQPHFEAGILDAMTLAPDKVGKFDVILASNVLEHLEDDQAALRNWRCMLVPKGHVIIIVPQYQMLYSAVDRAVGHYRRYNARQLQGLLEKSGFRVTMRGFGNPLGILGWVLNSVIFKNSELPAGQVRFYSKIKPFVRILEKPLESFLGLNLMCVAQRVEE